jgi:Domain of unknown function (DUF892)
MGVNEEGKEVMDEYKGITALDAGLLAAAQAVEHYEIALYGVLKIWANKLGYRDAALLEKARQSKRRFRSTTRCFHPSVRNWCGPTCSDRFSLEKKGERASYRAQPTDGLLGIGPDAAVAGRLGSG